MEALRQYPKIYEQCQVVMQSLDGKILDNYIPLIISTELSSLMSVMLAILIKIQPELDINDFNEWIAFIKKLFIDNEFNYVNEPNIVLMSKIRNNIEQLHNNNYDNIDISVGMYIANIFGYNCVYLDESHTAEYWFDVFNNLDSFVESIETSNNIMYKKTLRNTIYVYKKDGVCSCIIKEDVLNNALFYDNSHRNFVKFLRHVEAIL